MNIDSYIIKQYLGKYWWLVLLFLFLIANPSHSSHKTSIKRKYAERNPITSMVGGGIAYSKLTKYNNYLFFSTATTMQEQHLSFGILGLVFVSNVDVE